MLYGFGKRGDSSETRKNKRSPWDTLHSGRKWAEGDHQLDAMSAEKILESVASHFIRANVYKTFEDVLQAFISSLRQR